MNIKFSLFFLCVPFFAVGMDLSRLSSTRSHVPAFNCGYPHLSRRLGRCARIQRLTGARLNPNRDRTDEVGVKRIRNGGCSVVYLLSGDALALVFKIMRRLNGCGDLLCAGVEPTARRFLCGRAFVRMQGVFSGMHGVS